MSRFHAKSRTSSPIAYSSLSSSYDFLGGLKFSEVVADKIDSRMFRGSSFSSVKDVKVSKAVSSYQQSHVKQSKSFNVNCIPAAAPPECGIPGAHSRGLHAVFSGVERGKLRVSEKAAVKNFVSKLNIKEGSSVGSYKWGKGKRYEWLFANRSYSYGKNLGRTVEPIGAFSEVEHLCAGIVRDLQLAKPNACLLVYYPRGTSGLNCHKDDEPAHASDQVITLCHGVGASLVLEDNSRREVAREWLEGGDFYVFRDQKSFYHGVDGVESAGSGRWAFTFRVFRDLSETVRSVQSPRTVVSNSVAVAKALYDPMNISFSQVYIDAIYKWFKIFQSAFGLSHKWPIKSPPHILQKDNINCGVFICNYAYRKVHKLNLEDYFDPNNFRKFIFENLVNS